MTQPPRDRHTKRGKRAVMERLYKSRKWGREIGNPDDDGLHGKRVDRRKFREEIEDE